MSSGRSGESPGPPRGLGRGRGRPSQASSPASSGLSTPTSGYASAVGGMAKLQISPKVQPMQRPGFGQAGRPVKLETNFFPLKTLIPNLIFYRYDVEIIVPSRTGRGRGRFLTSAKPDLFDSENARQNSYMIYKRCLGANSTVFPSPNGMVYDRRRAMFSLEKLKLPKENFEWKDPMEPYATLKIALSSDKPVVRFENILEAMKDAFGTADRAIAQFLDIATNQFSYDELNSADDKSTVYTPFGRQFYKPLVPAMDVGSGRVVYDGFFKSVRMVMGEPGSEPMLCLNVDAKKAPFFKSQPLLDTVRETLRMRSLPTGALTRDQIRFLTHHLKGLKVVATHTKTTYAITYVSEESASDHKFSTDDGRELSVANYMMEKYKIRLGYPYLPCITSRLSNGKVIHLPMEILDILPNQKVDLKKSTPEQSQQLIRLSAVKPADRRAEILEKVRYCGGGSDDPVCKQFGIERQPDMLKVTGRVLPPPKVQTNQLIPVSGGAWAPWNSRLFLPSSIKTWAAIACFDSAQVAQKLRDFLALLPATCQRFGMQIANSPKDMRRLVDPAEIPDYFKRCAQEGVECVICFIEDNDASTRNLIKFHGDVEYDIVTQCIRKVTVCRSPVDRSTINNIVLKLNAKCGGINNAIADNDPLVNNWMKGGDVMFMGFDVNHPPALSRAEIARGIVPKEPSIVGAVANTSKNISKYTMQYYLQDSRQEEINAKVMQNCVTKFVELFKTDHAGKPPARVVVYRDGVSDTQFDMVLTKEIFALKSAFAAAGADAKITVVVVQKRHNTRFFPIAMDPRAKASQQNVEPGTVVDTGPVSPTLFDFYLCSHAGIQGTSKAAKYVVLRDENAFTADGLQRLTFVLAHGYQRCAKSVSLPAPVYFAHHAATRGKELYSAYVRGGNDDSSSGIGSVSSASAAAVPNFDEIQERIQRFGNRTFNNMTFL